MHDPEKMIWWRCEELISHYGRVKKAVAFRNPNIVI